MILLIVIVIAGNHWYTHRYGWWRVSNGWMDRQNGQMDRQKTKS